MILLSPISVLLLFAAGACWMFMVVCIFWHMFAQAIAVLCVLLVLLAVSERDARRDRSADGGLFTRNVGETIWLKAGSDD